MLGSRRQGRRCWLLSEVVVGPILLGRLLPGVGVVATVGRGELLISWRKLRQVGRSVDSLPCVFPGHLAAGHTCTWHHHVLVVVVLMTPLACEFGA